MATEDRLDRIENKLDTMAEAIISLARMEERMVTLFKRMDKYDEAQDKMDGRVIALERAHVKTGLASYAADKLVWLIVGALVAVVTKRFVL